MPRTGRSGFRVDLHSVIRVKMDIPQEGPSLGLHSTTVDSDGHAKQPLPAIETVRQGRRPLTKTIRGVLFNDSPFEESPPSSVASSGGSPPPVDRSSLRRPHSPESDHESSGGSADWDDSASEVSNSSGSSSEDNSADFAIVRQLYRILEYRRRKKRCLREERKLLRENLESAVQKTAKAENALIQKFLDSAFAGDTREAVISSTSSSSYLELLEGYQRRRSEQGVAQGELDDCQIALERAETKADIAEEQFLHEVYRQRVAKAESDLGPGAPRPQRRQQKQSPPKVTLSDMLLRGIRDDLREDAHPLVQKLRTQVGYHRAYLEEYRDLMTERYDVVQSISKRENIKLVRAVEGNNTTGLDISEAQVEAVLKEICNADDVGALMPKYRIESEERDFLEHSMGSAKEFRKDVDRSTAMIKRLYTNCLDRRLIPENFDETARLEILTIIGATPGDFGAASDSLKAAQDMGKILGEPASVARGRLRASGPATREVPGPFPRSGEPVLLYSPSHLMELKTAGLALREAVVKQRKKIGKDREFVPSQAILHYDKAFRIERLLTMETKPAGPPPQARRTFDSILNETAWDMSDFLNRWLLHRMRTSSLEAALLSNVCQSLQVPMENPLAWQVEVLKKWHSDGASNLPASLFMGPATSVLADARVLWDIPWLAGDIDKAGDVDTRDRSASRQNSEAEAPVTRSLRSRRNSKAEVPVSQLPSCRRNSEVPVTQSLRSRRNSEPEVPVMRASSVDAVWMDRADDGPRGRIQTQRSTG